MTLEVQTVTSEDESLLDAVRETIDGADSSLLCVAFAHTRGVRLIANELESCSETRLVVTTTFDQHNGAAIALATALGVRVRTLNPGSGTYHPKVYLSRRGPKIQAVVGSANLTAGLATNVEVAIHLRGTLKHPPLRDLNDWAESVWNDDRCNHWLAMAAEPAGDDRLDPVLLAAISAEVRRDPHFFTLGRPARNTVTNVTEDGVLVQTAASARKTGLPSVIPAWMFNTAWEYLNAKHELSNDVLLNHLRVHRSSAICAILARLPGVERIPGEVAVRLVGAIR